MTVLFADAKGRYVNVRTADGSATFQVDIEGKLARSVKSLKDKKVDVVCTGELKDAQPRFVLAPKYFAATPAIPIRGGCLGFQEGKKIEFKKSIVYSPLTNQPEEEQLSGYMAIATHILNTPVDNQPDGLLVYREHNRVLAKYHLEELGLPMGITDYDLKKIPPAKAQLAKCVADAERQIAATKGV